jgi:hypothetical protein
MYTALQVLSGIAMLAGAVVLQLTLRRYSATLAVLAAVAMASAGLLTLVTSALYATAAELADEYVAASPEHRDSVAAVARAFVLMLQAVVPVTAVMLATGVFGFAVITARHHLVPQWLRFVAAGSAGSLVTALVAGLAGASEAPWLFLMIGFVLLLLWLVVAGGWLLLGGSNTDPGEHASATDELAVPRTAS